SAARMGEFIALLFALVLGMFLMASATDLLMIYLAIETVSLVSYVLTSFRRADRKANEAALKYVIYGGVASGVMLYGMSILYGLFATTHVTGPGGIGAQLADVTSRLFLAHAFGGQPAAQLALVVAVVFVLAGVGYKIAIVQTNLKRLLAYSSIANAGYLLMGLAAASSAGVQSILVYLIVYVLMNVGAFLVVIAVSRTTGGEEITDFRGLGVKAPIAALS